MRLVESVLSCYPVLCTEAEQPLARLKGHKEHPRYEVLCEIRPLRDWLVALADPVALDTNPLLKGTIVALRLTTLMRSGDLHHLISNVLEYEGGIYLRCRDTQNKLCVHRVDGLARPFCSGVCITLPRVPCSLFIS